MRNTILGYLFDCVAKHPQKHAIEYRDEYATFGELDNRAYSYSKRIIEVLSEDRPHPIGVICTREIEPIIAFIGVIYSGNFYVPLDPNLPTGKLQTIIDDSGMQVIIGSADEENLVKNAGFLGTFISSDDIKADFNHNIEENTFITDDYPLYLIYTSGSTGKPKGVLKSHKAEVSFIEAYVDTFDFNEDDIIGNQTPFFFDAAAKDIYLMLKMGITMVIIPTELFPLPPELIQYLNQKKITVASWVPTVLSIVAQLNPFSEIVPNSLKKVFFVGEVMPMKHLNKWRESLPNIQYVNLYGQSELCGICCYYEVKDIFSNDESLPMGIPLKNCKIYLLDNETIIEEAGKIGEMFIVSDALAMEYYHDEEKTQSSFVMKDFGEGLVRCFKTGDLAQYDDKGNLIFSSRTDYQIKHMGHRIELGEIETVAGALEEITRCCCLYQAEKKKIILFCELAKESTISGVEIKSILKTKLSSYMVPWKVNILEKMPLNANGKIDRQKLKLLL